MFEHQFVYTFFGFCFLPHTYYEENVYKRCTCVRTRENRQCHAIVYVRERGEKGYKNVIREEKTEWKGAFNVGGVLSSEKRVDIIPDHIQPEDEKLKKVCFAAPW